MRVASICVSTIVSLKVFQNINELCRQILYCFQSKVVRDAVIGSRDPAGNSRNRVAVPTEGDRDADSIFKVLGLQKRLDCLRNRALTACVKAVFRPDLVR